MPNCALLGRETSPTSIYGGGLTRASRLVVDNPEPWDFSKHPAADLVVINIGTNDHNAHNNVSTAAYIEALTKLIQGVHGKWPQAQVIVMVRILDHRSLPVQSLTMRKSHSGSASIRAATHIFPRRLRGLSGRYTI